MSRDDEGKYLHHVHFRRLPINVIGRSPAGFSSILRLFLRLASLPSGCACYMRSRLAILAFGQILFIEYESDRMLLEEESTE
jgi:hypothetical protein